VNDLGGRKKPSISQLEKRAKRQAREKEKKREKKFEMALDSSGKLTQASIDQIISEIKRMQYVTPYVIASKFGLKISRARKILRKLSTEGVIRVYDYNRRVPIYIPAKGSQKGRS